MRTAFRLLALSLLLAASSAPAPAAEGAAVRGRAVDEDGAPVEGAPVRGGRAEVATGKDGLFSLPAEPGPFPLAFGTVFVPGGPFPRSLRPRSGDRILFLGENEGRDLGDVVYRKTGALLAGTVRDADGKPLAGARLHLATGEGWFVGAAVSGPDGAYRMKVPTAHRGVGLCSLRAAPAPGRQPDVVELDGLAPWEATAADVRCGGPRGRIEGTAALAGAPLAGAEAYLFRKGQKSAITFHPVAKADDRGRFAFEDVPAGSWVVHLVHPKAFRAAFPAECPGAPLAIDLAPRAAGAVEGSLRILADGRPLLGGDEAEDRRLGVSRALFLGGPDGKPAAPLAPVALLQAKDGGWVFRAENLPEGEYRFLAMSFQREKTPLETADGDADRIASSGVPFLHEGRRLIPEELPLEEIGIVLKAAVRRGETARIDVRKEFTVKELQALMEQAGR
ncbi:MAG: carboxypeptidase-like regulatory domain-containing protein [Planctomycetes bacterium]|jgi:hypothetical protein|nr:carboxypeptidase-like regulatory domain-containing protein [Planctomycetota bacterium]